jgi:hypothetical protein
VSCCDPEGSGVAEHTCHDEVHVDHGDGAYPEPALLDDESGRWRLSCTAACETLAVKKHQFLSPSLDDIPLTVTEERAAELAAKRHRSDTDEIVRGLHTMLTGAAASKSE